MNNIIYSQSSMREADKEGWGLTEEIGINFAHFSKSIVIENLHVYFSTGVQVLQKH